MRLLLAIETSTQSASVCAFDLDASQMRALTEATVTAHAETLMPLVDQAVVASGATPADIAAIACGAGPGSYTGLRIGVATAKGLAFARDCPLVLVSSLEAVAHQAAATANAELLAIVLDAKKGQTFVALFRILPDGSIAPASEEAVMPPRELATWTAQRAGGVRLAVTGDGAHVYASEAAAIGRVMAGAEHARPSAKAIAELGASRLARGETTPVATAEPRYASEWKSGDPKLAANPPTGSTGD